MDFLPFTWFEGLILAVLGLITYIYRQDRLDARERVADIEMDIKRAAEAMNTFTANMAIHQQKIQYLEKQLDAIFQMLREIRDEMRGKQDKTH